MKSTRLCARTHTDAMRLHGRTRREGFFVLLTREWLALPPKQSALLLHTQSAKRNSGTSS